jgi:hypothetical protein
LASSIEALKSPVSTRAQLVFVALLDEEFGPTGLRLCTPERGDGHLGDITHLDQGMAAW